MPLIRAARQIFSQRAEGPRDASIVNRRRRDVSRRRPADDGGPAADDGQTAGRLDELAPAVMVVSTDRPARGPIYKIPRDLSISCDYLQLIVRTIDSRQ